MKREWKPGDVARLKGHGLDTTAIRTSKESWAWVDPRGGNPTGGASFAHESWGGDICPLVVIDPEDRDQVERLLTSLLDSFAANISREVCYRDVTAAQTVLREFANPTPPKPEEPTGLGAVVEDAEGHLWVRASLEYPDRWRPTVGPANWRDWPAIAAVRVLSEGVTP